MRMRKILFLVILALVTLSNTGFCDDGYELWLNYKPVKDAKLRAEYAAYLSNVEIVSNPFQEQIKKELDLVAGKMLGARINYAKKFSGQDGVVFAIGEGLGFLTDEGYKIRSTFESGRRIIYIQSASGKGLLYGAFGLIRLMQCGAPLDEINITESPKHRLRMLNHWDDLDGHIERGYAGSTLWNWDKLPRSEQRYTDYARANASIGINAIVLNNVNADPRMLRGDYLKKVAALADAFRKYNIQIFLCANFAAPMKPSATPDRMKKWGGIGVLDTADPLNKQVIAWWTDKAKEIYALIPDFGGFLVKANSEGMPGPQDYGRTHSDGANMLARALRPYDGLVMWRTFVYNADADPDRAKRPYKEFLPLDGAFDSNVILQAKNGPLDFQPREPIQPLFGAMPKTNMMAELQITQEYLGHSTYLVYLLPMWREFFGFDTYCKGPGSTVARLSAGEIYPYERTAIAGVANTGSDRNWCGHHFAQANWYAYGRLAWNPECNDDTITDEWITMTWNCDPATHRVIKDMMLPTWESFVRSQTPYAIGITCSPKDHFDADFPGRARKSWNATSRAIGYDRTTQATDYVSQYFEPNRSMYDNIATCPENVLLYFHLVEWDHKMKSGRTFKEEFFEGLSANIRMTERNIGLWNSLKDKIDAQRWKEVSEKLDDQMKAAQAYYQNGFDFFNTIIHEK